MPRPDTRLIRDARGARRARAGGRLDRGGRAGLAGRVRARDLITLSGLRPGEDIEIKFSGVRPGEKLFEQLSTDAESADKTKHPKIFIGRIKPHGWDAVVTAVDALVTLAADGTTDRLRNVIAEIVPEYQTARGSKASSPLGEPVVKDVPDDVSRTSRKSGTSSVPN